MIGQKLMFISLPRRLPYGFLTNERLLKQGGIYVDQSQRTSRFWKCSLDPEKFCVRSQQENGLRVIAIVIKEKVERIDFILWLRYLRLFPEWVLYNSYDWNILLLCDSIQTYLWRSLGIDIIFTFLSALFQRSHFVWITPFLVVLRLTWFKLCFIFQIVKTLSTNDWFATYTKTLNQFLETIIAKGSLKISGLNVMDYFQAFFSLLS